MTNDSLTGPIETIVSSAHKRYREIAALDGLSLSMRRGEWIGLIGPNGAGKTTLMHAISGLVQLDSGTVTIRDASGELQEPGHAHLGLVPQELALYKTLTTIENLRVFGRLNGLSSLLEESIEWALTWTGLEAHADRRVEELSIGMQRRLNIACGVLHRPAMILLDEPTVGVDPHGRSRIWEMLESLRANGSTLLQSSHQLGELESRCDRLVIVDHGRVLAEGTMAELSRHVALGRRSIEVLLDRSPDAISLGAHLHVRGNLVVGFLDDVERELAPLLDRLRQTGARITDMNIRAPNLEQVFTALTGSGLRE